DKPASSCGPLARAAVVPFGIVAGVGGNSGVPAHGGGVIVDLRDDQIERYSRHLLLPEVGWEGQERLRRAKVVLVGAGGLGSPVGFYLAAAGVGTLGVVDADRVELSNLQRQIAHTTGRIGTPKVESAQAAWQALNPDVTVVPHAERLRAANARAILGGYDLVVECSDNFPTRFLVNDTCVQLRTPLVSGAVYRFEGQVLVVRPGAGPCYRCLFAAPPPAGMVPTCLETGILGVVPGVIGALQATEVVKLILGIGEPLAGRLLLWNALEASFTTVRVPRNPGCPVCGEHPTITAPVDEEPSCAT
ncbi:MAG TPA: molybdopterin-synthase adenylyltransferase MoeB, partial [Candidatus Methanoperedens sp.]|nr:molybdopterin-synthase adenylyltransferase MoeB [Candidatus Methanoperedens sp.]